MAELGSSHVPGVWRWLARTVLGINPAWKWRARVMKHGAGCWACSVRSVGWRHGPTEPAELPAEAWRRADQGSSRGHSQEGNYATPLDCQNSPPDYPADPLPHTCVHLEYTKPVRRSSCEAEAERLLSWPWLGADCRGVQGVLGRPQGEALQRCCGRASWFPCYGMPRPQRPQKVQNSITWMPHAQFPSGCFLSTPRIILCAHLSLVFWQDHPGERQQLCDQQCALPCHHC